MPVKNGLKMWQMPKDNFPIIYKILNMTNEQLNKIADIFRKTKREPKIDFIEHEGICGITVDTPRTQKGMYHGSSFEIGCNKPITICNIGGDLAAKRGLENNIKENLEKLDCDIVDIHRHPEKILAQIKETEEKESHIHFRCSDKNMVNTIKIVNFIKDY